MTPFNKKYRNYQVNLFSDFIVKKLGSEENSLIEVADCENFYVVKGKTSSKKTLDLNTVKNDFFKKFPELFNEKKLINTIDLIEYSVNLETKKTFEFQFHNSVNCSYTSDSLINFDEYNEPRELIIKNNFPFGYSLSMGRLKYYYGKHIIYNIPPNYPFEKLTLKIPDNNFENGFEVVDPNNPDTSYLKSAILDCFDFDMSWLRNKMKKVDWSIEVTNPLEDYKFLKKKIKNFIMI